jgi:hypothetical protein
LFRNQEMLFPQPRNVVSLPRKVVTQPRNVVPQQRNVAPRTLKKAKSVIFKLQPEGVDIIVLFMARR